MNKNLIHVRFADECDWLELRAQSIGGSDAPSVVGLSPYKSPYTLWAEKTGKVIPEDVSSKEAVRIGHDLEEYVAKRFCEATGKKVRRENSVLRNPDYPFAHASVDRLVVGENAGLECKTTSSLSLKTFKNGEFPDTYYVQCMHYMAVTGADRWYLAVLVLGREFLWYEIPRDEDEIASLMAMEQEFWGHVENQTPPPADDGSKSTTETLDTIYAESDGSCVNLFGRGDDLERFDALGKHIKELEKERDGIAQRIKQDMGSAEKAVCDGGWKVSWKSEVRSTLDKKAFETDHPGMLTGYFKTTPSRPFKVTKTA